MSDVGHIHYLDVLQHLLSPNLHFLGFGLQNGK